MDASNAPDVVALGAESRNNPLGLCLAKVDQGTGAARLLSIAVQPEYRGTGVASALIRALDRELIARGCTHVCANYVSDLPSRPYLERLLNGDGWQTSRPQTVVYRGRIEVGHVLADRFRSARLLPDCEITPWAELSPDELFSLRESLGCPQELSPFQEPERVERNSLVLRRRGVVVGWHITHRVLPDTIRYSQLFVRPDLRPAAQGCALIAEAVRRHVTMALAREAPYYQFHVRVDNGPMLKLAAKRINSLADSAAMVYEARKRLRSASPVS
jgi:ribosomal protein S18 acetylase RimI-like enzyme